MAKISQFLVAVWSMSPPSKKNQMDVTFCSLASIWLKLCFNRGPFAFFAHMKTAQRKYRHLSIIWKAPTGSCFLFVSACSALLWWWWRILGHSQNAKWAE